MKTLLRINAGARIKGSHSRDIGDYYEKQWLKHNPGARVTTRDLAREPIPHLDNGMIEAFQKAGSDTSTAAELSDSLIRELKRSDHVLICSPLYNFTVPSTLKAYFDFVVRYGLTVENRGGENVGLLSDKSATILTVRGGVSSDNAKDDFQTEYLREILAFMGITSVDSVLLEGTTLPEKERKAYLESSRADIDALFQSPGRDVWTGQASSPAEKAEINRLRTGQSNAIMQGDAEGYANICTEDIQLMIPGHDIISGREGFLAAEKKVFENASFILFEKRPENIHRSGDVVVETGRQRVRMKNGSARGGIFAAHQKYTHVYRLTPAGWRYAVLMSNHNE